MVEAWQSETVLQRLCDEASIRRLPHEYADAMLTHDSERMLSLWAGDVPSAPPPDLDHRWARRLSNRWPDLGITMLHITTHSFSFDDAETAHGRVYCLAQLESAAGLVDQSILYDDWYAKRPDGWRFARRRHLLWFGQHRGIDPLAQRPTAWPENQVGVGDMPTELAEIWERYGDPARDPS